MYENPFYSPLKFKKSITKKTFRPKEIESRAGDPEDPPARGVLFTMDFVYFIR